MPYKSVEKRYALTARWRAANPGKVRAHRIAYREGAGASREKYRSLHRKRLIASRAKYRIAHPERVLASRALRRARERNAATTLTDEERGAIIEIYRQRDLLTKLTGVQYHVDHKLALANGGKHHPDNLQVLPAVENMRKGARIGL